MVKVILSVPEYCSPAKSVPDTVAMVEVTVVDTVQTYSQTDAEPVALIKISDAIPDKEIVGVTAMLSEKVAVMVTTSELETILSESVSVKMTVGGVVSKALKFNTALVVLL